MASIQTGGFYRHFKGSLYQVLAVAQHTERMEELVIYADRDGHIWARPTEMFLGTVQKAGKQIPRFCPEDKENFESTT